MAGIRIEDLHARLERLERENRRLKRIGTAAACVVVVLALSGARDGDRQGVLRGERLELANKDGNSRVILGESADGLPCLTLERTVRGRSYSMRQELFVAGDGTPVLVFVDHDGTRRYKIPR
jgi:hypothetical protein